MVVKKGEGLQLPCPSHPKFCGERKRESKNKREERERRERRERGKRERNYVNCERGESGRE